MKYSAFVTAANLWSSVVALELAPRENPKVIGLDIQRRNVVNPVAHDALRRRQKTVQQTLDNLETLYFANASLGTPEQNFRLHIDTGSSDLWVNSANSELCTQRGNECGDSGTYSANDSSTYAYVNSVFNISYVDGSGARGDYATDAFRFGGQTVDDLQFGIGYSSSSPEGILGIGYTINEVQVNRARLEAYANLPQKLKDDGKINSVAYSLWLNDLDASTGSILFGGVDTDKFEGSLQTLPILKEQGVFAEFLIALTSMGANGSPESMFSNEVIPVLLDSGSSLMYLPDSIVQALYTRFSARYDSSQGAAFVDCDLANQQGTVDFGFSGVTISVPLNELVITAAITRGRPVCILGISPAGQSMSVLGDTFLRSAYVVYDLSNNEISLAQTRFNATASSVQEIQNKAGGVPNANAVTNAIATASIGSGAGPRINGPTVTGTSTAGGVPAATVMPWVGGAAAFGAAGLLMGFNGL